MTILTRQGRYESVLELYELLRRNIETSLERDIRTRWIFGEFEEEKGIVDMNSSGV